MTFVPDNAFRARNSINFAPMIDFLFLMLAFFASLAISRMAVLDTDLQLVRAPKESHAHVASAPMDAQAIQIAITAEDELRWVTEIHSYTMASPEAITAELDRQYAKGLLPQDKAATQVFLKIDSRAHWEPILRTLFAIRDAGFDARPIYEESQ